MACPPRAGTSASATSPSREWSTPLSAISPYPVEASSSLAASATSAGGRSSTGRRTASGPVPAPRLISSGSADRSVCTKGTTGFVGGGGSDSSQRAATRSGAPAAGSTMTAPSFP
ncbi:MAG: hypothetical protein HYS09_07700 [Chloroflexi bacterium]|nr:hypothetical protein [Chloroflexota bacterium]